jgi:hypothetical protein
MPMKQQVLLESGRTTLVPNLSVTERGSWLRWAALAWALAIMTFHIVSAALGRSLHRYIHLGEALGFARGSINLLKPVIIGWNLNGSPTPQDLPLWQAAVAVLFKCFGVWFGLANIVSLVLFFSCLYPLFRLAERFGPKGCGWWTVVLFLAQPIVFLYAGLASSDGFALALAVWFMFFATRLMEEKTLKWMLLTTLAGALAAVSKFPFFLAAGLACFFMVVASHRRQFTIWLWLGIAALLIGAVFEGWEKYANHCYAQAELPYQDLTTSNPQIGWWFFGDLEYRLSPGVWVTGGWRALTTVFGSFALGGVFLLAWLRRGSNGMAKWWLVGGVGTTLIFFHLVLHTHNYYLMFAPGVALLCGELAFRMEPKLQPAEGWRRGLVRGVVMLTLAMSTAQGLAGAHVVLFQDDYMYALAQAIQEHTRESDKLFMYGGDLTGELLVLSNRNGLSAYDLKLLDHPATYERLKSLGFTKVVMVSESPLVAAIKRSTKIHLDLYRLTYHAAETPTVEHLPTVLQNEDILIKELR